MELSQQVDEIKRRMDDFNIRNDKFYAEVKEYMKWLENRITELEKKSHTHFWMNKTNSST